jgi:hypothetical protein
MSSHSMYRYVHKHSMFSSLFPSSLFLSPLFSLSHTVPHLVLIRSTFPLLYKRVAVVAAKSSIVLPRVAVVTVPLRSLFSYRSSGGGRTHEIDHRRQKHRNLWRDENSTKKLWIKPLYTCTIDLYCGKWSEYYVIPSMNRSEKNTTAYMYVGDM